MSTFSGDPNDITAKGLPLGRKGIFSFKSLRYLLVGAGFAGVTSEVVGATTFGAAFIKLFSQVFIHTQ